MKAGKRKNEGDVVKSFLDGKLYRINGSDEKAVELSHVQESENDDGKKYFTPTSEKPVTVRSCVFDEFFYLYEKAPAKAPENGEFVIRDGVLLRNGKKVECGTLVPLEIKALIPGAVILTVRSREEGRMGNLIWNWCTGIKMLQVSLSRRWRPSRSATKKMTPLKGSRPLSSPFAITEEKRRSFHQMPDGPLSRSLAAGCPVV